MLIDPQLVVGFLAHLPTLYDKPCNALDSCVQMHVVVSMVSHTYMCCSAFGLTPGYTGKILKESDLKTIKHPKNQV